MTAPVYHWRCGCGEPGRGEKAAIEHGKTCPLMGYPWTNPDYPKEGK